METLVENEVLTLLNELKGVCQVLAQKKVETLILSFDMKDKTSQIFGSSIGIKFIQHLALIEKFNKYCEDVTIYEKEGNKSLEQDEELTEGINHDDTETEDSFEISDSLETEDIKMKENTNKGPNDEENKIKCTKKERENEMKMRFPITPRITRSVSKRQKKMLSSRSVRSNENLKMPVIRKKVAKSTDQKKGYRNSLKRKIDNDLRMKGNNKKPYDSPKMEGGTNEKKNKKEHNRQMKEEDKDTDKENAREVSYNGLKSNFKKEFVCKICNEVFDKYLVFQDHVKNLKHLQDQNLKCNICDEFFVNMRSLGQHRNNLKHFLKCDICEKYFTRLKAFGIHQRLHKREKRHLEKKIELEKKDKNFKCEICNVGFSTTKGLGQHRYRYRHYHKCNDCGKMFSRKKIFDIHCRKHDSKPRKWKQKTNIPKQHQCNICGKVFSKSYPLRIHIRYHTGEKPYMCDICGKVTASKTELNMHKLIHSDKRPYSCNICNKSFRMLNKLKRHQIVHTGLKPHRCQDCGKCFTTASNMRTHVKNIHMGIKAFACDICDIKFAHSSNMRAHMKGVHRKKEIHDANMKSEVFDLLKSKEGDMNSDSSNVTGVKCNTVKSRVMDNYSIQKREYQNKKKINIENENREERNMFNEINADSKMVIQILPSDEHGSDSLTHDEATTIIARVENQKGSKSKGHNKKANDIETSLKIEHENSKDMIDDCLYIDESSVSSHIKLHQQPLIISNNNKTKSDSESAEVNQLKTWCSPKNNRKDLKSQEEVMLKRHEGSVKSRDLNKRGGNSMLLETEGNRKNLQRQGHSRCQNQVSEKSRNELKSYQFGIVLHSGTLGVNATDMKKGDNLELDGESIKVIQIQTQNIVGDKTYIKPVGQIESGMEKGICYDNIESLDRIESQMEDDFELQMQEQVVDDSNQHPIERELESDKLEQEQVTSKVLVYKQEHLPDRVELHAQEQVVSKDVKQMKRQYGDVSESQGNVIGSTDLHTHCHVEDEIMFQEGGKHKEKSGKTDLQRIENSIEGFAFQTEKDIGDIELQMEEQIIDGSELQIQEDVVNGVQIQEDIKESVLVQEQTVGSGFVQKQNIGSVISQEQTIENVLVEKRTIENSVQFQEQTMESDEKEQSIDSIQEQTIGNLQVQEQTIGSEHEENGTIIQLAQDSEIHAMYQPEYGEISDNVPHLIYLYPSK